MCGIAGIVALDGRPVSGAEVKNLTDPIVHRGPDGHGIWTEGAVGFGHRRLAIIDLTESAAQPMVTTDGRFVMVFNGEIYNYLELRSELSTLGVAFHGQSDSEVLLAAYAHWGSACLPKLNGMWSFAIWDTQRRELFLSRDRFGIKPLYYCLEDDRFTFASEIKALVASRPELRRADHAYLATFVVSGSFDYSERTSFLNIRALLPGCSGILSLSDGKLRIERHWQIDQEAALISDPREAVDGLRALLESSIRLHLRSDVPLGACLSGGLDSSLIVSLATRERKLPMMTYSALYPDIECDESRYVAIANRATGAQAREVKPEPNGDLIADLERITWHQDEPTAGPGLYSQYHVMRRAHGEVKVLLDGQGSDELFGGYLFYFRTRLQDLHDQGPFGPLSALMVYLRARCLWTEGALGSPLGIVAPAIQRLLAKPSMPQPDLLHPDLTRNHLPVMAGPSANRGNQLRDLMRWQLTMSSVPALLHYEDRNSMAFSIESRVPFLDHRLVEYALRLDPSLLMRGTWTKWALRCAGRHALPRQIAWRRSKMGYPTPFGRWLRRGKDRDDAADVLLSARLAQRGIVSRDSVERLWKEHQGGADRSWLIYRLLTLELWFRRFIDAYDPAPAQPFQGRAG